VEAAGRGYDLSLASLSSSGLRARPRSHRRRWGPLPATTASPLSSLVALVTRWH